MTFKLLKNKKDTSKVPKDSVNISKNSITFAKNIRRTFFEGYSHIEIHLDLENNLVRFKRTNKREYNFAIHPTTRLIKVPRTLKGQIPKDTYPLTIEDETLTIKISKKIVIESYLLEEIKEGKKCPQK